MSDEIKGHGSIGLSTSRSNTAGEMVVIRVRDHKRRSGIQFLELHLTPEQFGRCLAGNQDVPCEFSLRWTDSIGKKRERKTELVEVPKGDYDDRERRAAAAIAPFEVDGWSGSVQDACNRHHIEETRDKSEVYRVSFSRLVDYTPPEPMEAVEKVLRAYLEGRRDAAIEDNVAAIMSFMDVQAEFFADKSVADAYDVVRELHPARRVVLFDEARVAVAANPPPAPETPKKRSGRGRQG